MKTCLVVLCSIFASPRRYSELISVLRLDLSLIVLSNLSFYLLGDQCSTPTRDMSIERRHAYLQSICYLSYR